MVHIRVQVVSLKSKRTQIFRHSPVIIGRKDTACLLLESWRVGPRHAQLVHQEQQLFLEDFGSLQGTLVNEQRIKFYGPVQPTDTIIVGPYQLRVQLITAKPETAEANRLVAPQATAPATMSIKPAAPVAVKASASLTTTGDSLGLADSRDAVAEPSVARATMPDITPVTTPAGVAVEHELTGILENYSRYHTLITLIKKKVLAQIDLRQIINAQSGSAGIKARVIRLAKEAIQNYGEFPKELESTSLVPEQIIDYVVADLCGLGILEPLLNDTAVTEIMVNGVQGLFVERAGRCEALAVSVLTEADLRQIIERIVAPLGRRVDESMPMVDARLENGSRAHIMLPPIALNGPIITIRKFSQRLESWQDLIREQSVSADLALSLQQLVRARKNILVTGGTSSGKTTLLNILSASIPEHERIITIEDSAELCLHHANLVRMEARPANAEGVGAISIRELVRQALRMRPDRIIVGECRGAEAFDMLTAMNTGHEGSLTTLHANSPREALHRLESLILMAEVGLPFKTVRDYIAMSIHWIIHLERDAHGVRRVQQVSEITGMEGEIIQLDDFYQHTAAQ